MGILTNLLLSLIHLVLIAIDVTMFFVLIRMLCYRWHWHWLEAFNTAGKPLVDRLTNSAAILSNRIARKNLTQRGLLNTSMITLVIVRTLIVALFTSLI